MEAAFGTKKDYKNEDFSNVDNRRVRLLCEALRDSTVYLENCSISKEAILEEERRFLCQGFYSEEHTTSIFMHTGSTVYDAVALVIASLANIVLDEDASERVDEIEEGQIVIYQKRRYRYAGKTVIDPFGERLLLKGDDGISVYLSYKNKYKLIPYNGDSKKLSGKGVKNNSKRTRIDFLKNVVGLDEAEITSISNQSTVLLIDPVRLDYLLKNIEIGFENVRYPLIELVTVTYYTPSQEFRKKGNIANNEPDLKATNNIEKARELVMDPSGSKTFGFVSFNKSCYEKTAADFEMLFNRKRIAYSWLIVKNEIDEWIKSNIENDTSSGDVLALVPQVIRAIGNEVINENRFTSFLHEEVSTALNRHYKGVPVESEIIWKDQRKIKQEIKFIIENSLGLESLMDFSHWAYSALKFFNNIIFSIEDMKRWNNSDQDRYGSGIEKFSELTSTFPTSVREEAVEVLDYIKKIYRYLYNSNPKGDVIKSTIFGGDYHNALFVVPSNVYISETKRTVKERMRFRQFQSDVTTEAKFKKINLGKYDLLIFTSLMKYDKVNPLDIISVPNTLVFVYDSQLRLYNLIERQYISYLENLENRITADIEFDKLNLKRLGNIEDESVMEEEEEEHIMQNSFINAFIANERYKANSYYGNDIRGDGFLEAVRAGVLDDGESIVFTKGYIAYVYDQDNETVLEKPVDSIEAGDNLIFTVNDDNTKDIVDDILSNIVMTDDQLNQSYKDVKHWKNALRECKRSNGLKYTDLSRLFKNSGFTASSQTVRMWIDEDSHIVGPKNEDAYLYIGKVASDQDIIENYLRYWESSKVVRSARVRILKLIEKVVIAEYSGVEYQEDDLSDVIDRIREISIIKKLVQVETLEESFKILPNRANWPING